MSELLFANLEMRDVESAVLTTYERICQTTLYPGDPVRLFLESLAYTIAVQNQVIDLAGRQGLVAFAQKGHLDHLGKIAGVTRLPATAARLSLRFSLASPLGFDVPVPIDTRATVQGGGITFTTLIEGVIKTGETYTDIPAVCTVAGAAANGLVTGQVSQLVDPLPYIVAVTNTGTAMNGADIESDDRLRLRIQQAPETYTVAGSIGAYKARVLAVSTDIEAVSITSPSPGIVDVRFLLTGGEMPDAAIIEMVRTALSAEDVRPLTDNVLVKAPDPVPYNIRGYWYLRRSDATMLASVTASVAAAVEKYRLWQRSEPGRDIVPSRLVELVMQAGAKRVSVESPEFKDVVPTAVAREGSIEMLFSGLEDD